MHVFWLNGGVVLEPENDSEREALALLVEGAKKGRPQWSDPGTAPTVDPASSAAA
jgi:hypothetical protein